MKGNNYLILSQYEWAELFSSRRVNFAAFICISVGYTVCLINDGINIFDGKYSMPSPIGIIVSLILTYMSIGILTKNYYLIPISIISFDVVYIATNVNQVFFQKTSINAIYISYSIMYFIINSLVFKLRSAFLINLLIFMFVIFCTTVSLYADNITPSLIDSKSELVDAVVLSASGLVLQHLVLTVRALIIEQLGNAKIQMASLRSEIEIEIAKKDAREQTIRLNRISVVEALGASIAHEINQPIAAALTYCHAVRNWSAIECQNAPETLAAIRGVEGNVDRASRLIDNIRLLTSNKERKYAQVDLQGLISDQIDLIRSEVERRGINLTFGPALGDLNAVVCAPEIALATINLLRNATESFGEVKDGAWISVHCHRSSPDWFEISVADNGIGLTSEGIEKAFEAFQTTKQGGVGIGLSICQEVAEHHSGSISLTANSAGGVTATLRLAARPQASKHFD